MKGRFITIEGIEGAGKSTALTYLKKYFSEANIDVVWTREPGGTLLAEEMRALILHSNVNEVMTSDSELLLMFAGRAQHLHHKILPALTAGKWVVSDRFVDASYAYQGGGRKMDKQKIAILDEWIVGAHYPDLTLLLDISPEQGFERAAHRGGEKDRIEQEKMDFFHRVRQVYLDRAKESPQRIKVVDASVSLALVEQQLHDALNIFRTAIA